MHHSDRIQELLCTKTTLKKNKMGRLRVPVLNIKYKAIVIKTEWYSNRQDHVEKKNKAGVITTPDFKLIQS